MVSRAPNLELPLGPLFDTEVCFYSQSHVPLLTDDSGRRHEQFGDNICPKNMIICVFFFKNYLKKVLKTRSENAPFSCTL